MTLRTRARFMTLHAIFAILLAEADSCPTLSCETSRSDTNRARRGTIVAWAVEKHSGVPRDVYLCVGDDIVCWPRGAFIDSNRPSGRAGAILESGSLFLMGFPLVVSNFPNSLMW